MSIKTNCPICAEEYLLRDPVSVPEKILTNCFYDCARCGQFVFDSRILTAMDLDKVRHLISAWIRRQNVAGIYPAQVGDILKISDAGKADWYLKFERMGFPHIVDEKMNALLLSYANIIGDKYLHFIKHLYDHPSLISDIAAKDMREVEGLNTLLQQVGYIDFVEGQGFSSAIITAAGWLHIDQLRKGSDTASNAFIAMWFNETKTGSYRKAVIKAVESCHYSPIIIDQYEFNGFIMDQVITLIRQARFVIADFTCAAENDDLDKDKIQCGVRGGVYWEAGFAYGLNRPVIHTCKDDEESLRRIHFDVDQYNTIFWKDSDLGTDIRDLKQGIEDPNFMEKLANRILSTVGEGNYVLERANEIK